MVTSEPESIKPISLHEFMYTGMYNFLFSWFTLKIDLAFNIKEVADNAL